MSEVAVARPEGDWPGHHSGVPAAAWQAPDTRRILQLALGALWLLDAILQAQSVMFTRAFSHMLAGSAAGNPALVAHPISWSASLIAQHGTATNAGFAAVQLLLGLGIAGRRTVRVALAASIIWSLAVWWLGEGLGGVLTPAASPVTGAPGAVIIYALLAVLLWPRDRAGRPAPAAPAVHFPLLALILAQFMVGYVMWTADRLPTLARVRAWRPAPAALAPATVAPTTVNPVPALASHLAGGPASTPLASPSPAGTSPSGTSWAVPRPPLSPRLASCCNIVMGLVMGYMLIISR